MEVAFAVRNYIRNSVKPGNMFTTRELLGLGNRNTIDQVIYRLIKEGTVIRLAWGVFVRKEDYQGSRDMLPSATAVAYVKAEAFGRNTFIHGDELEEILNLIEKFSRKSSERKTKKTPAKAELLQKENSDYIMNCSDLTRSEFTKGTLEPDGDDIIAIATDGHSTSFWNGKIKVVLKSVSARKRILGDTLAGMFVRALWSLGKDWINCHSAWSLIGNLKTQEVLKTSIFENVGYLPTWMTEALFGYCEPVMSRCS